MKEILDIEVSNEFKGLFRNKEIKKASEYCDWISLIEYRFADTFDYENFYEENCEDEENAKERYSRFTDRQKLLVDMLSIGKNVDAIFFINNFREASEYIINRYDTHFINDEKRNNCLDRLEKSRIKFADDTIDLEHILPYLKFIYNNCSEDVRLLIDMMAISKDIITDIPSAKRFIDYFSDIDISRSFTISNCYMKYLVERFHKFRDSTYNTKKKYSKFENAINSIKDIHYEYGNYRNTYLFDKTKFDKLRKELLKNIAFIPRGYNREMLKG